MHTWITHIRIYSARSRAAFGWILDTGNYDKMLYSVVVYANDDSLNVFFFAFVLSHMCTRNYSHESFTWECVNYTQTTLNPVKQAKFWTELFVRCCFFLHLWWIQSVSGNNDDDVNVAFDCLTQKTIKKKTFSIFFRVVVEFYFQVNWILVLSLFFAVLRNSWKCWWYAKWLRTLFAHNQSN